MQSSQSSVSYDDGLYHPTTATASAAQSIIYETAISTSTIPHASSAPSIVVPLSIEQISSIANTKSQGPTTSLSVQSALASPSLVSKPFPPNDPTQEAENHETRPPTSHSVMVTGVILTIFFSLIFIVGFLTSKKFRNWKDLRWFRHKKPKWTRPDQSYFLGSEEQGILNSNKGGNVQNYDAPGTGLLSDPFARSIFRPVSYENHCSKEAVEQIGDERGWFWGTKNSKVSRKSSKSTIIPGLGTGRYRAKSSISGSKGLSNFTRNLGSAALSPSNYSHGSQRNSAVYFSSIKEYDEKAEDDMNYELDYHQADNRIGLSSRECLSKPENSSNGYRAFVANSAASILTRLKDSLSSRSRPSNFQSSEDDSHSNSRGKWNGLGQWEIDEELDYAEEEQEINFRFQRKGRDLSLAEIPLPEVPILAWDAASTPQKRRQEKCSSQITDKGRYSQNIQADPDVIPRRINRTQNLSPQGPPQKSYASAAFKTPIKGQRESEKLIASSPQPRTISKKSRSNLSCADQSPSNSQPFKGITNLLFPSGQTEMDQISPSRSQEALKLPKSESYTNFPTLRAQRQKRRLPQSEELPGSLRQVHPGGFVGRSPTKKLKRKKPLPPLP
ncbi:hypothetical protein BY996DRAFT_6424827 [Phakopsora pachyrhizi]|uniref:Expressed protein n=1 Tax=Phakopsora pachyrhizi TaxID=170000 RepID=A0AAV0BK75_PHAPC|nr:hypothetical protein BY996DRAFT_6424827 [Phakopsora pachyrhizi]CAH7686719.1 expressed protein [Phakopsora pachyrhizi]